MNAIIERLTDKGQGSIQLDLTYQPGIALVIIDNPKRHNALSGKMMVEFHHAITQLEKNIIPDLVAVIFMGGGSPQKSFCAGLDLSFARHHLKETLQDSMAMNQIMYHGINRMTQLPLITMAIVTGGAIGGGSELLTGFDFVCMSQETGFIHFVQTRMGVSSPWGGMHRLKAIVGKKRALQWMAGGYKINANQGFQAGFVDLVVEKDVDCLKETLSFLNHFLLDERTQQKVDPNAVRGMKKLSMRKDGDYDSNILATSTVFSKL